MICNDKHELIFTNAFDVLQSCVSPVEQGKFKTNNYYRQNKWETVIPSAALKTEVAGTSSGGAVLADRRADRLDSAAQLNSPSRLTLATIGGTCCTMGDPVPIGGE